MLEGQLDAQTRRCAERLADVALRDELVASGCSGISYTLFEVEATRYGLAVITKWLGTGEIYARAAARQRVVRRPNRNLTFDERVGLAHLVVTYGLRYFKQAALGNGQWRPDGGASLKTFFIGACLLQFKAAFEVWRPDVRDEEVDVDEIGQWLAPHPGEVDQTLQRLRAWKAFADVDDPITRRILVCQAAGLNHPQTAALLGCGLTADAVSARLTRLRQRHHRHDPRGRHTPRSP
ncbi:MAG: hypothetical protein JXA67_22700 [Micromonosporaceae bacterium]|nr:hypothetical protein [Micromonosporaceae bacterium]